MIDYKAALLNYYTAYETNSVIKVIDKQCHSGLSIK